MFKSKRRTSPVVFTFDQAADLSDYWARVAQNPAHNAATRELAAQFSATWNAIAGAKAPRPADSAPEADPQAAS